MLCVDDRYGHLNTVKLLLQHKANPLLRDGNGDTPLDVAVKGPPRMITGLPDRAPVIALLKEHTDK